MPRGGRRPGAGRPRLTESEKEERKLRKEYDKYVERYVQELSINRYGLQTLTTNPNHTFQGQMSFSTFKLAYKKAVNADTFHPISAIIRSQREYFKERKKADRAARTFNRFMRDARKNGSTGAPEIDELLDIVKKKTYTGFDFFRVNSVEMKDILDTIWNYEAWYLIGS